MATKSRDLRGRGYTSKVHAELSAVYNMLSGLPTIFPYNMERYDPLAEFDAGVTYLFTPLRAGYYLIKTYYFLGALPAGSIQSMYIDVNGIARVAQDITHVGGLAEAITTTILYYLTPNDAVSIWCGQNSGAPIVVPNGAYENFVTIFRIG